ncbi:hypothetical protein Csp2054_07965 [Curtobacterium sp. 'Ferrero']|uniref:DUF1648 domain-containing protein n=1 Tax=Curtobacterium sp. 'Ferrero' TaxID=2033654 RepID=UPI000BD895CB|nr:DUF1648 domain-containing protein [Curtobacterium sp. 'Ferrero']PCN48339.1 hypothetical protein Csp2054_07965 [Curtobacterium sp. 'Ferrero']
MTTNDDAGPEAERRHSPGIRLAVLAPTSVVTLVLAGVAVAAAPGLPGRVATHFGPDGTADGWGSPWTFFWIAFAVAVAAVAVSIVALRMRDRRTAALVVLVPALIAPVLVAAWIAVVVTALNGSDHFAPWWAVVFVALGGAAAAISVPPLVRSAPPVPARDVAPLPIGEDARVAWRGHVANAWFTVSGLAAVVGAVVLTVLVARVDTAAAAVSGVVLLLAGVSSLVLAWVDVTVDRRGLRLTSTWARLPIMRVPLERIESCGGELVSPGQWGGWGYRISGRGIAYVAKAGPGIVVRLRGGGARMVTVDDAERGTAVLGALLAARSV